MSIHDHGRYTLALVAFSVGLLMTVRGFLDILNPPTAQAIALGVAKGSTGVLLLPAVIDIAKLRTEGLWFAFTGFGGVVAIHAPQLAGQTPVFPTIITILSLFAMLYLLIYEDAFGDKSTVDGSYERELTMDTNPHEFIR